MYLIIIYINEYIKQKYIFLLSKYLINYNQEFKSILFARKLFIRYCYQYRRTCSLIASETWRATVARAFMGNSRTLLSGSGDFLPIRKKPTLAQYSRCNKFYETVSRLYCAFYSATIYDVRYLQDPRVRSTYFQIV